MSMKALHMGVPILLYKLCGVLTERTRDHYRVGITYMYACMRTYKYRQTDGDTYAHARTRTHTQVSLLYAAQNRGGATSSNSNI